MLPYCDEVVAAAMDERHSRLLAEAQTERLVRQHRSQSMPRPYAQVLLGRLIAAGGLRLVQWGEQMQAYRSMAENTAQ